MCASAKNVTIPTPHAHLTCAQMHERHHPHHPHHWRSISHVCKCMNVIIPTTPITGVASHMCPSAKNVTIPAPAHQLRSISHVCKCMNVIIPTPPPHHPSTGVASHKCANAKNVTIPTPAHQLRSISHVCKCKERHYPHPISHVRKCMNVIIPTTLTIGSGTRGYPTGIPL